eukprot:851003-Alexandrium_andersonii.AAC.1
MRVLEGGVHVDLRGPADLASRLQATRGSSRWAVPAGNSGARDPGRGADRRRAPGGRRARPPPALGRGQTDGL